MHVTEQSVKRLARNGVVLAGPELASKALVKDSLANNLRGHSHAQHDPRQLERPPDYIEIPASHDERDGGSIGDTRRPCCDLSVLHIHTSCVRCSRSAKRTRVVPR